MDSSKPVKRKKAKKPETFGDAMKDIDDWANALEGTKQLPRKPKKTSKCVFINMERDVESGSYQWKNPGKVYKRRHNENAANRPISSSSTGPSIALDEGNPDDSNADVDEMDLGNEDLSNNASETFHEVLDELEKLEKEFPAYNLESKWEARKRTLDENWSSIRQSLFQHNLIRNCIPEENEICGKCKEGEACIRCISCMQLLCSDCDNEVHSQLAFHNRECWIDGFFKGLGNRFTIKENKLCEVERPLPVFPPSPCPNCHEGKQFLPLCTNSIVTIVTPKGRFNFNDTEFSCTNCFCTVNASSQFLMIMSGYWPASPQKTETFYSFDLLELWDFISNNSPGTSLSSFIKSIEAVSRGCGRAGSINATSFGKSYREWAYCQSALNGAMGEDAFLCPVCSSCCHSIHIDGHRKTYRFKKVPRGSEKPFYKDRFIVADDAVHNHMKKIYEKMGSQEYGDDKMCGGSHWQAARAHSKKSFASLDETGLVVAGCRHVIALKAVNMFAGEQYGYTLYLHNELAETSKMKFLWLDIMCKYWPWLEKVVTNFPELSSLLETKSALSVMHAKVHSLDCQVVWGGTYQESAALSTGESMEQFFSYLAKCGITTKNMNAAARIDILTERTSFWNLKKIENLAKTLRHQYVKAQKKFKQSLDEKQKLIADVDGLEINDILIDRWEAELKNNALYSLQRSSTSRITSQIEEYFHLNKSIEAAEALSNYAHVTNRADSIISDQEAVFEVVSKSQNEVMKKRRRMKVLEEKLCNQEYRQDELLRDGKTYVVDRTIQLLQTRITHLHLNLNQQHSDISRLADTSKKRIKLRKAVSSTKASLNTAVDKYNTVAKLSQKSLAELSLEDAISGTFCWNEKKAIDLSDWTKKRIVDKHIIVKRCQEELSLCIEEMRAFCSFYKKKIAKLKVDIDKINGRIRDLQLSSKHGDSCNSSDTATVIDQELKCYCLSETPSIGHLMGLKSVVFNGMDLCRNRLADAVALFKATLHDFDFENESSRSSSFSSDDEDDDDVSDSDSENEYNIEDDDVE